MTTPDQSALRRWWWRQQFVPGAMAWLINPFFHARRGLAAALRDLGPELRGEVLDVGCGRKPYRSLTAATRYVGVDVDSPATRGHGDVDVFYDGRTLPFAGASFDGVLCSQVFEHVFAPREFLAELARVLRPGGTLLLTTPVAWDEHEQPHDFARYSSFGLRATLEAAGFEVVTQRKTCADGRALAQLATAYLFKTTGSGSKPLNALAQFAIIAPVTLLGALAAAMLPRNADFYLDNVVLARRRATPPAA
jgi:SAM-dependent methyltransferase